MGTLMETTEVKLLADKYRKRQAESEVYSAMSAPTDAYYSDTVHTIAINTRETEFGSIVEPIPIMLKTYQPIQPNAGHAVVYGYPPQLVAPYTSTVRIPEVETPSTSTTPIRVKDEGKEEKIARPPKKKWIKEYLEEEPKSPVSLRVTGVSVTRGNSVLRPATPPIAPAAIPVSVLVTAPPPHLPPLPPLEPAPAPAPVVPLPVPALVPVSHHPAPIDFIQEHSRPRNTNGHGPPQIPSPSSVGSNSSTGSVPRAGTREVHNKLEKNRRAHLKECFELLKRQLPATPEDKKTSNLSILGSAIRYIQVLRRKERECEHEMERLAREKIAAQQRLAALKREVSLRSTFRPRTIDVTIEEDEDDDMIGPVIGIPLNIPPLTRMDSPPRSLNLSTKLRSLPIQITPSTSQMVGPGGLVLGPSLQLLPPGLRLIHSGVSTDSNKNSRENGSATSPSTSTEGVVVSGMPPLVLSPPHTHTHTHVLHTHTLTHKVTQ